MNPLIAAASEGRTEVVDILLADGRVKVDASDKDGTNALMAASVRGHKDVAKALIEHKASVNAQNVDGHTALMFAYNGKNQVQTLMDKYKEYMKDSNDDSTKLLQQALQTHLDLISILRHNGADISLKDNEGHTTLDFDYKPPKSDPLPGSISPKTEL